MVITWKIPLNTIFNDTRIASLQKETYKDIQLYVSDIILL